MEKAGMTGVVGVLLLSQGVAPGRSMSLLIVVNRNRLAAFTLLFKPRLVILARSLRSKRVLLFRLGGAGTTIG